MSQIVEYISTNYTWILGGAIIILLAIIGSYADKTNFGQGKQNDLNSKDEPKDDKLTEKTRIVSEVKESEIKEENVPNQIESSENNQSMLDKVEKPNQFDNKFKEFEDEFNEVLPEKEIIDGDLLDEINSLSLDKTQKISLSDIPDLDDVELPKIKKMKSNDEDIWKI